MCQDCHPAITSKLLVKNRRNIEVMRANIPNLLKSS